jgi:2-dehydro-3-deoxy-D-arabinonate dehydratase
MASAEPAAGPLLPPIEPDQEVWASGVAYLRSRDARKAESATGDIYEKVYEAERPELFFKALGRRVVGPSDAIRVRRDSRWNVPEPELTLVINCRGEIVGYCAGNDVSSRDIEGANPLYLPQAKVYNGSCALGPGIALAGPDQLRDLAIVLAIERDGQVVFWGETRTSRMKRSFEELAAFLYRELAFPGGAFLMTGTGIVPDETFSLGPGDRVRIQVGELLLENETQA